MSPMSHMRQMRQMSLEIFCVRVTILELLQNSPKTNRSAGENLMSAIQTRPINDDAEFLSLAGRLNEKLARFGFPMVRYKGSISWLGGQFDPNRSTETFFKLLYRGLDRDFIFGGRLDFFAGYPKLSAIEWPTEFCVMPSVQVKFGGFEVATNDMGKANERLEKILALLPEPDPGIAIRIAEPSKPDLDTQLSKL